VDTQDVSPRVRVSDAVFPSTPGVYVVWQEGHARPLYVGVAASQTIAQRWRRQHLCNRSSGSALRRSLGPHAGFVEKKLSIAKDGRYYPADVEAKITALLRSLDVEFYETERGEDAVALELQLIEELRPLLNSRRPRIKRSAEERAVLAEASLLFREVVKPTLLEALKRSTEHELAHDSKTGYVLDVQDNLLAGISLGDIEPYFQDAAGHELEGKMKAPWSSSALAVNSFAPWRGDSDRLRVAGHSGFQPDFSFEHPCPNKVSRIHPHLDIILERPGEVVAIESKFTEYLQGSDHPPVSASYRKLAEIGDDRAGSRWFAALDQVESFLLLDAYQLVKHYLGLVLTFEREPPTNLTLVYLYWEPKDPLKSAVASLVQRHRREIEDFRRLVAGDPTCAFEVLSYEDHWRKLRGLSRKPPWLDDHLDRLEARYLVTI
jgi:Restriction Endonuclease associating with ARP/GIY-YIG catalytic domain